MNEGTKEQKNSYSTNQVPFYPAHSCHHKFCCSPCLHNSTDLCSTSLLFILFQGLWGHLHPSTPLGQDKTLLTRGPLWARYSYTFRNFSTKDIALHCWHSSTVADVRLEAKSTFTRCRSTLNGVNCGSKSRRLGSMSTGDWWRPRLHRNQSGFTSPQKSGPIQRSTDTKRLHLIYINSGDSKLWQSFYASWCIYEWLVWHLQQLDYFPQTFKCYFLNSTQYTLHTRFCGDI